MKLQQADEKKHALPEGPNGLKAEGKTRLK